MGVGDGEVFFFFTNLQWEMNSLLQNIQKYLLRKMYLIDMEVTTCLLAEKDFVCLFV